MFWMVLLLDWSCQDALDTPALPESCEEGHAVNADSFRPFGYAQCLSVKGEASNPSRVTGLFGSCCPTAILRRIGPIIVDSVNAMLRRRSRPHVFKECLEAIAPTVADGNSATAIIAIVGCFRIETAGMHGSPCAVLGSFLLATLRRMFPSHDVALLERVASGQGQRSLTATVRPAFIL